MRPNPYELPLGGILVALLLTLAVGFGYRQLRPQFSPSGVAQRITRFRRLAISAVMLLMAALMLVGLTTDPTVGRHERRLWSWSWLGVMVLAGFLLLLGLWDYLAVRAQARRQRLALAAERRALQALDLERRRSSRRPTRSPTDDDPPTIV